MPASAPPNRETRPSHGEVTLRPASRAPKGLILGEVKTHDVPGVSAQPECSRDQRRCHWNAVDARLRLAAQEFDRSRGLEVALVADIVADLEVGESVEVERVDVVVPVLGEAAELNSRRRSVETHHP